MPALLLALLLQLAQSQLNLQALISPEAIIEAEVAALNAETALNEAIENLELLISPAVYQAETELKQAQAELAKLQAATGTSAEALYQLEKGSLRTVLSKAVWAAYERSRSLGDTVGR